MRTRFQPLDVPSPIDLQSEGNAKAWAESADQLRPWRTRCFEAIGAAIPSDRSARVLEVGLYAPDSFHPCSARGARSTQGIEQSVIEDRPQEVTEQPIAGTFHAHYKDGEFT